MKKHILKLKEINLKAKLSNRISKEIKSRIKRIHPAYRYIRVIPDTGVRNRTTENIAKAICSLFKMPRDRMYKEKIKTGINKKGKDKFKIMHIIELPVKVSYIIEITKTDVSFIFQVPSNYYGLFIQKAYEVWPKATAKEIYYNPILDIKDASCFSLSYKFEDALSFDVNKSSNDPLSGILNVIDNMTADEKVYVVNNFVPISQNQWSRMYDRTMEKIRDKKSIEKVSITRSKKLAYLDGILTFAYGGLSTFFYNGIGTIMGYNKQKLKKLKNDDTEELRKALYESMNREEMKGHKYETKEKGKLSVLDTQVLIVSKAPTKQKADSNAIAICNSYRIIDEDNKVFYDKITYKQDNLNLRDVYIKNVHTMICSTLECNNFIQLPGDDILKTYPFITNIAHEQIPIPKDMQEGVIYVGQVQYRDGHYPIYANIDEELKNIGLILIGPPRSGKELVIL